MAHSVQTQLPELPPCDHRPAPYRGPSRQEVARVRQRFTNPAIRTFFQDPLMIVEGYMQYLFDETGRRYLDFFGGIATVSCGHAHPQVIRRVRKQLERLQHTTTIYLHPNFAELAGKLASKMPPGLEVTYFVNSGSEANDLAVTLARLYTGNHEVIALHNGYHGGSALPMELTGIQSWKYPLAQPGGVHHAPCPDPYRSRFTGSAEEIAHQSAEQIRDIIRFATPGEIGAFICEPIQGVGGITCGAPNYLGEVYQIVHQHGGLCIADEVQTAFGRTGDHYWGFEDYGVIPDIVTMAKGLGNGIPIAAVTTRREIAECLAQRSHFNTFGGNPVSMAAALAVLDVIDEDGLQENARRIGAYLKAGLQQLQDRHPLIGDVRGKGLMLGVELVKERRSKDPAAEAASQLLEECRRLGLLIGKSGLHGNVLRFLPPLCITEADANFALGVLDHCLGLVGA